jgi:putative heme-binding domain-containing protein
MLSWRVRVGVWSSLVGLAAAPAPAQEAPTGRPPELVASTEARTPEAERAGFRVPPGFVVELVAAEPDIAKPMNLAFDAKGRLWVTSSLEYPFKSEGESPRDRVTILDDLGPDGRARSITTFAGGLNIPIGVLPLRDGALVHSIPSLYHLTDADGDGKADRRDVWYTAIGSRDTHGMANAFTWGLDGWIYGCHGFANESTVAGTDGRAVTLQSGNTYRLRPDGSHIEAWTRGQVNPFGLAFTPRGDLLSCDCHSRPVMMLLRGAFYQSFGKPHDGLGFGPEIMTHDHGSTGIGGIVAYAAEGFPAEYRHNVFIGNVVTSRVNRDRLDWTGSSPRAVAQPDLLVSDDPWFRPVDLELGPDGALYVADFYNKIIGHYEVPLTHPGRDRERGRVWRIRYEGPAPHAPAAMSRADWGTATIAELIADLGHANIAVRTQAANGLAWRGSGDLDAIRAAAADASSPLRRAHALWVLHRLGGAAEGDLERAAKDDDGLVRTHAQRVLAETPDWPGSLATLARAGLTDADPFVRRVAADALGRHPSGEALRGLLDARRAASADDPQLVHTIRMALRDQFAGGVPWPKVEADGKDLEAVADIAPGVHDVGSVRFLLAYLAAHPVSAEDEARFLHHAARYGDEATDRDLLALARKPAATDAGRAARRVLEMFGGWQERGATVPEGATPWAVEVALGLLRDEVNSNRRAGLGIAATLKARELGPSLRELAASPGAPVELRHEALSALNAIDVEAAREPIRAILERASEPIELREHAAGLLGQSGRAGRELLCDALPAAPGRLQGRIAVALAGDREGAERLLGLIASGKASARLLQDRELDARLKGTKLPDLDARVAELTRGLAPADEAIGERLRARREAFLAARPNGENGRAVFQKHCAACHQLGGEGARVGPQLDGIGVRGLDRLLEDTLDPNRNVDQAFRVTTLALDDGRVVTGLLQREEGELLILADAQGQEVRVPKSGVEERQLVGLSLMPANLADGIPEADYHDLMRYLLDHAESKPKP